MAVSKLAGGFECEFVEKPPQIIQTECLICLLILREPYQVICCGKSYCRSCIERVKALDNPCPHCNERNFNDFPNKGYQQIIYQLKVYCTHQKEGCEWTGELGELDNHLNLGPQPNNQLKGCVFVMVKCTHCSESHQRQHINHHQTEECPKRPFTCEHCKAYKSTFEDVTTKHHQVCKQRPFSCEYCKIFKSTFDDVTTNHHHVCKKRPFTCEYCKIYKSTFEEVTVNHHKVCTKRPFSCKHCKHYTSTFEDVTTNHWPVCERYPVECSNKCGAVLQRQNLESHVAKECPLTVIECDFHYAGCEVKLPRKDMGEHLHVELVKHTSMMATSYQQQITSQQNEFATYKQQQDQDRERLMKENETKSNQISEMVKENKTLKQRLTELEKETERIKLWSMIDSTPPVEIVIPNFRKIIETREPLYSPPFYTHYRGYKLCLRGQRNFFVKIYVHLMQGEFDNELKWPLKGEVTIQLLSQDGSNEHLTKLIQFTNQSSYSRVTNGEISQSANECATLGRIRKYIDAEGNLHFKIVSFKYL